MKKEEATNTINDDIMHILHLLLSLDTFIRVNFQITVPNNDI